MQYELNIATDKENEIVRLNLLDEDGLRLAGNALKLSEHAEAYWQGLFDTRRYVTLYQGSMIFAGQKEAATAEYLLEQLGVFLGTEVLGEGIMEELLSTPRHRTLLVRLPTADKDPVAAAFARVPWEIARLKPGAPALVERHLAIRAETDPADPDDPKAMERAARQKAALERALKKEADKIAAGEPLKILLVFAEAPGSRPLAMRLERELLLNLFYREIFPKRNVRVDFLCHGATLNALKDQIARADGYHIVHWSGHGHQNSLVILGENGKKELISGEQLAETFQDAGGFIPHVVFLSACLSGSFVKVKDWETLKAALQGKDPEAATETRDAGAVVPRIIQEQTGYTGTALELIKSHVPQVIAMRYEVGDDYARELAVRFYRRLLADPTARPVEEALALARNDLLRGTGEQGRPWDVDHATPLFFGRQGAVPAPLSRQSPQVGSDRPKPHPLLPGGNRDLDTPDGFVGRSSELTRLKSEWLPPLESGSYPGQTAARTAGVALVQGMAGLGKTAIAAEAIHLWHTRFKYVICIQSRDQETPPDEFYRRIDSQLNLISGFYRQKCEGSPYECAYLPPGEPLAGKERFERMRQNLLAALRDEAVLLVLDNFETHLDKYPKDNLYPCADREWDELLSFFARELADSGSRALVTSRRIPAALAGDGALRIPLGPLPLQEAVVFVRSHPRLSGLLHGDASAMQLAMDLLDVSRGHPLILQRLAALSDDPKALSDALQRLKTEGYKSLPDIFAPSPDEKERDREMQYLEDVAVGSVDLLLARLSPDARRLLWVVTIANEPVGRSMLEGVWAGRSVEDEQLEQLRALLKLADMLPPEVKEKIPEPPPELLEQLKEESAVPDVPPLGPLLDELCHAGLVQRETAAAQVPASPGPSGDAAQAAEMLSEAAAVFSFHELVRERIEDWMENHKEERGGRDKNEVRVAYGKRYAAMFNRLEASGQRDALDRASEAGARALTYMVRAGAFSELGSFASALVTGTRNRRLLDNIVAELRAAADRVPPGEDHWSLLAYLADALRMSGHPNQAVPFFEQAAAEAQDAGDWADAGWILGNLANALLNAGKLDQSREFQLKSAEAFKKAGSPEIKVVASELEAFRIDVYQGKAREALPAIESRLEKVRSWWQRHWQGEKVEEAPDPVDLARALVSGLDIAREANQNLEQWQACLDLLDELERVKQKAGWGRHERYITRFNKYGPLVSLGRLDEARQTVEACLEVYREEDDLLNQSKALGALADIRGTGGDLEQAVALERKALAVRSKLPDLQDRSISHHNLSEYLYRSEQFEESAGHLMAAIVYRVLTGHGYLLGTSLNNLKINIRQEREAGRQYRLPPVADLVKRPEFDALARFLSQNQVDHAQLQARIDQLVEQTLREPQTQSGPATPSIPPEIQALFEELAKAAAQGQDLSAPASRLKAKLLETAPGQEAEIDAMVQALIEQFQNPPEPEKEE